MWWFIPIIIGLLIHPLFINDQQAERLIPPRAVITKIHPLGSTLVQALSSHAVVVSARTIGDWDRRAPTLIQVPCYPPPETNYQFWFTHGPVDGHPAHAVHVQVIQEGDTITFIHESNVWDCPDLMTAHEQGLDGYLFSGREMAIREGHEYQVKEPVFFHEINTWVVPVRSIKHAVVLSNQVPADFLRDPSLSGWWFDKLWLPAPGIQVLEAWSPEKGMRTEILTIWDGARVRFDFNERGNQ